jgi:hypothetical protein
MRPVLSLAFAGLLAVTSMARPARASEPGAASLDPQEGPLHPVTGDDDPHDEFEAFPLVTPHDPHYFRALLEVQSIALLGFIDYLLHTRARGGELREGDRTWELRYDWEDLRGKFTGEAYELDANKFATNYASHTFAGTMYFTAARSNHLSFAESFLFAVLGSATWDYFYEIREKVSINDTVATPVSGAAVGEATMQLAGFFRRGRKQLSNDLLAFLFAPVNTINEALDQPVVYRRSGRVDALGFPSDPWHRFEVYGGAGFTVQERSRGRPRAAYDDLRFGASFDLANLPGYAGAGRHARLYDDGNVSSLRFDGTVSPDGGLVDATFATRVVPFGFYFRDATAGDDFRPYGRGSYLGLRIGFEYGAHDYDRDRARPRDLISLVSPLGVAAEHVFDRGRLRIRTGLDVYGSFAGVQAYALSDFRDTVESLEAQGLPLALKNNSYYHGLGVTAAPSVDVTWGALHADAQMRLDNFRGLQGLDDAEPAASGRNPTLDDRRVAYRASLGWRPSGTPLRISLAAQRLSRAGDVGEVHASRSETSTWGTIGLVF